MPPLPPTFGQLPPDEHPLETSRAAILPVPFERTTSYGQGTARGPAAILDASQALELWDEELGLDPSRRGIATLPPFVPEAHDLGEALAELEAEARRHVAAGRFLVALGGEHSITSALVRATAAATDGALGVVQFDAHADLRDTYEGTPWSHAAVMRRVLDDGHPHLPVGIRSLSEPEARLVDERGLRVLWAHEMAAMGADGVREAFEEALEALPETIYLTFDIDYFDPSLVPATGTPEPGGGTWWPTLELLRVLFRTKTVVAMDLVELAPLPGQPASDFLAAKLVYKCLGYLDEVEEAAERP